MKALFMIEEITNHLNICLHFRLFFWLLRIIAAFLLAQLFPSHSFLPDTVEDLIRTSAEGQSLEDVDARESVASWFSQGQRSKRPNYRSWPSEGHVTAMEDSP